MKIFGNITAPAALLLLAAGAFTIPAPVQAAETEDSAEVTQLLEDVQRKAVALKVDSANLESFTRSNMSWVSYANKLTSIRENINTAGVLLAKLKDAETAGSAWQQAAIRRVEPLLKELADNTTLTINHLNDNKNRVHLPAFHELVKANNVMAANLESLIGDYTDYADAKQEFERIASKVGVEE